MCETDTDVGPQDENRDLGCSAMRGSIGGVDQDVASRSVAATIYSSSCEGGKGGDIHFVGVCEGDTLARLAIADVAGHGRAVSDVSQYLYDSLEAHICEPVCGVRRHLFCTAQGQSPQV